MPTTEQLLQTATILASYQAAEPHHRQNKANRPRRQAIIDQNLQHAANLLLNQAATPAQRQQIADILTPSS
jgi:hypothetical protein